MRVGEKTRGSQGEKRGREGRKRKEETTKGKDRRQRDEEDKKNIKKKKKAKRIKRRRREETEKRREGYDLPPLSRYPRWRRKPLSRGAPPCMVGGVKFLLGWGARGSWVRRA